MKYGITANEARVLGAVSKGGGNAYLNSIYKSFQKEIAPGAIHNILARLEKGGFVKSAPGKLDTAGPGRRSVVCYEILANGEEAIKDRDFVAGRQWSESEAEAFKKQGKPPAAFNKIARGRAEPEPVNS